RLADHPITRGRNDSERVNKIIAFTGQSLKGPPDSIAFMKLADSAVDAMPGVNNDPASAAGRAQGIAITFGKGRVVVLGEAAMMSDAIGRPEQDAFRHESSGNRQSTNRAEHHALAVRLAEVNLSIASVI